MDFGSCVLVLNLDTALAKRVGLAMATVAIAAGLAIVPKNWRLSNCDITSSYYKVMRGRVY